jgi:hypothetical protein
MDTDTVGKLVGFAHWGQEAQWNKQEYEQHKAEVFQLLKDNKDAGFEANETLINQWSNVIKRKQHQMNTMKLHAYGEMLHALEEMLPYFRKMHAELYAKEIENSFKGLQRNTFALHDAVTRQSRVLDGIDRETFDEFVPHILYLYDKEKRIQGKIDGHAFIIHKNALKLVNHMDKNYFGRLAKIADQQFRTDHSEVLRATYLLSVSSRAVAKIHGLDTTELQSKETIFMGNIAPYK